MKESNNAFQVLVDTYVTDDSGTGIVHSAPAFGEVREMLEKLSIFQIAQSLRCEEIEYHPYQLERCPSLQIYRRNTSKLTNKSKVLQPVQLAFVS